MSGARHSSVDQAGGWPNWLGPDVIPFIQQYENLVLPGGQVGKMPSGLNQQVAGFTPTQVDAFGNTLSAASGAGPELTAGQQNLTDTLSGKFLDPASNPYLTDTYKQAARGLTDAYALGTAPSEMAGAARAGAMGGSGLAESEAASRYGLGENLANLGTDIYGGNYQQERQRQMTAAGLLPGNVEAQLIPGQAQLGVGSLEQQQAQQGLDVSQQNALRAQQFPMSQLDAFGQALQTALGPSATSTTISPNRAGWLK